MHFTTVAAALFAATAPFVAAADAVVKNNCASNICVYKIQAGTGAILGTRTVAPGKSTSYAYPASGAAGQQLQVSPTCQTNNVVYYQYSVGNPNVYYSLNSNNGNPFSNGFSVTGSSASCPKISCPAGSTSCLNMVKACADSNTITFNACSS